MHRMTFKTLIAASALALSLPLAAQAQGTIPGAERGAAAGADAAGPAGPARPRARHGRPSRRPRAGSPPRPP
ncbi:hypothetical protein MOF7_09995 [Methylobacterium oryzae]